LEVIKDGKENMKYLITGSSGFVAKHLINKIHSVEPTSEVIGIDVHDLPEENTYSESPNRYKHITVNLLDYEIVQTIIEDIAPNYIIHLASYSSVAFSWENPVKSFMNNVNISLNILEAVRLSNIKVRILSIGSSEQYGQILKENIPVEENCPQNPTSPYAISRVSQEKLSILYAKSYGLDIVCTRSFNHIGPYQSSKFVVSSFVKQMVHKKNSNSDNTISVGNINVVRDFTDVRDVVDCYYLLLHKGKSGQVYNVCSSRGTTLNEILNKLEVMLSLSVNIQVDNNLLRPIENDIIIGSYKKIKSEIGWSPKIHIEKSLRDIIDYWEDKQKV
jgi:GDP-4-dehydro-6-deoxy-D-mannose reductase